MPPWPRSAPGSRSAGRSPRRTRRRSSPGRLVGFPGAAAVSPALDYRRAALALARAAAAAFRGAWGARLKIELYIPAALPARLRDAADLLRQVRAASFSWAVPRPEHSDSTALPFCVACLG